MFLNRSFPWGGTNLSMSTGTYYIIDVSQHRKLCSLWVSHGMPTDWALLKWVNNKFEEPWEYLMSIVKMLLNQQFGDPLSIQKQMNSSKCCAPHSPIELNFQVRTYVKTNYLHIELNQSTDRLREPARDHLQNCSITYRREKYSFPPIQRI